MTSKVNDDKHAGKSTDSASLSDETIQEIKDKLLHAQECAVDYIKKNPLKSMGLTLLAGVVIAQIMHTRK